MVVPRLLSALCALCVATAYGNDQTSLTADDYAEALQHAEETIDYSRRLLPVDGIHTLLDETETETAQERQRRRTPARQRRNAADDNGVKSGAGASGAPPSSGDTVPPVRRRGRSSGNHDANAPAPGDTISAPQARPLAASPTGTTPGGIPPNIIPSPSASPEHGVPPSSAAAPISSRPRYISSLIGRGRGGTTSKPQIDMPSTSQIHYGITIGTVIEVELNTGATNVQTDYVILDVMRDVYGSKRMLKRGSKIFCRVTARVGSSSLYLNGQTGLAAANDFEFRINGSFYAKDGTPGLVGIVESDPRRAERVKSASSRALASGAVSLLPGGVAMEAGKTGAQQAIQEYAQQQRAEEGAYAFVVSAQAQHGTFHVAKTF